MCKDSRTYLCIFPVRLAIGILRTYATASIFQLMHISVQDLCNLKEVYVVYLDDRRVQSVI